MRLYAPKVTKPNSPTLTRAVPLDLRRCCHDHRLVDHRHGAQTLAVAVVTFVNEDLIAVRPTLRHRRHVLLLLRRHALVPSLQSDPKFGSLFSFFIVYSLKKSTFLSIFYLDVLPLSFSYTHLHTLSLHEKYTLYFMYESFSLYKNNLNSKLYLVDQKKYYQNIIYTNK